MKHSNKHKLAGATKVAFIAIAIILTFQFVYLLSFQILRGSIMEKKEISQKKHSVAPIPPH